MAYKQQHKTTYNLVSHILILLLYRIPIFGRFETYTAGSVNRGVNYRENGHGQPYSEQPNIDYKLISDMEDGTVKGETNQRIYYNIYNQNFRSLKRH